MGARSKGGLSWYVLTFCASIWLAGGALSALSGKSAEAAEISTHSFWNSEEVVSHNLRPFWKWREVLQRYAQEVERSRAQDCPSSLFGDCPYEEWRRFLADIADRDRWGQLVAVNAFMNARRYIPDARNWGVKDYWATPGEFMTRSGDCEDYAIAKYLSLRELGWSGHDLRVVVVRDSNLKVAHAVLVAFLGGRTWLLDNQTRLVTETAEIRHYRPVFSINEEAWWHHRPEHRFVSRSPSVARPLKLDALPAGTERHR